MKRHRNLFYEQTRLIYLLNAALDESVTLVLATLKKTFDLYGYLVKQLLIKNSWLPANLLSHQ